MSSQTNLLKELVPILREPTGDGALPVVDVYEQNDIRKVHKVPVPKNLSPGFERMGHLTEFIALDWLSKALQMNVTRVYILRRLDHKIGLIRFKHTVARGHGESNFVWSATPFHTGAKVIVCCRDEKVDPALIKKLPELSKIDQDGVVKSKLRSLRKLGHRIKRSVSFVKEAPSESGGSSASSSDGLSPPGQEKKSGSERINGVPKVRREDFGSEGAMSRGETCESSEGGWVGSESSHMSSPRQLPPLEDEHLDTVDLGGEASKKDDPLLSHVRAALEATDTGQKPNGKLREDRHLKTLQLEAEHVEILKHLDPEDLKDPLLLQVALLEARVATAAAAREKERQDTQEDCDSSKAATDETHFIAHSADVLLPHPLSEPHQRSLFSICMQVQCACRGSTAEDAEDIPEVMKMQ